jgi:hypothetical protein
MMIHPHDPDLASGVGDSTASEAAATIESIYRHLVMRGLSAVAAGNVVAYLIGLRPAQHGWTVEEIKQLVVIRSLIASGVMHS